MSTGARTRTDPRIRRRRRAVARTRRRKALTRLAVVGALGAAVWATFWSPLLDVRNVRVTGGKHTTGQDVADAAGLNSDDNLLLVSTADIQESAEALPWVKSADVDRMLPGTVRVRVVERKPAMILSLGAARWTIDATGRVLAAGEEEESLPILGGIAVGDLEPGTQLRAREVREALKAWRGLPDRLRVQVEAIFAPTIERITLSLTDGTQVRFGAAERLTAKYEVLGAVLARLRERGSAASYIDVRVPTNPAVSALAPSPAPTPSVGTTVTTAPPADAYEPTDDGEPVDD